MPACYFPQLRQAQRAICCPPGRSIAWISRLKSESGVLTGANIPFAVCVYRVHFWPTLLAKVLVRALTLFHNAYAPTVLPNAATITQNEQSTCVIGERVRDVCECLAERRARIFLVSANASCDLFLVYGLFVRVLDSLSVRHWRLFLLVRPLAPPHWFNFFR